MAAADSIAPPLPALYGVAGVAADDRLNVRAEPDARAPVIGDLAHDATAIEVFAFSKEGLWAQVNIGEGTGWAALRFLAPQAEHTDALGLPAGLSCFGTEPFWNLSFLDEVTLIRRTPDTQTAHPIVSTAPDAAFVRIAQTGYRFIWQSGMTDVTAHILPGQCSDGMSDRRYGLHYIDNDGPRVGCCSLR